MLNRYYVFVAVALLACAFRHDERSFSEGRTLSRLEMTHIIGASGCNGDIGCSESAPQFCTAGGKAECPRCQSWADSGGGPEKPTDGYVNNPIVHKDCSEAPPENDFYHVPLPGQICYQR